MSIVRIDTLRSLAFGGISGSYAPVGSSLDNNWRMFRVINNTDGDIFVSVDGTNDNLFVPAGSFVLYDIATNTANTSDFDVMVFAMGTRFYVKQSTAPTKGSVYIEGLYARSSS